MTIEIGLFLPLCILISFKIAKYFKKHPDKILLAKIIFIIYCLLFLTLIILGGSI